MWANDFPHSDATWPTQQADARRARAHLAPSTRARILHDNVAELYGLA